MEIKFLKTHPDAQLPKRNHGNREILTIKEIRDLGYGSYETPTRDITEIVNIHFPTADSGYDIFAVEDTIIPKYSRAIVPTGIKVAYISPGYWFRIEARSGLSFKSGILPHPGIIDNQYRGDTGVCMYNHSDMNYHVKRGDKIAQLVIYKVVEANVSWADELHETDRGEKGFGSSGR